MQSCRLYLISPPAIELPQFAEQLREAFSGGAVGAFQLRLKNSYNNLVIPAKAGILDSRQFSQERGGGNDNKVSDDEILKAAEVLIPICREYDIAFILNDSPKLAKKCGADGVHLGQDDGSVKAARKLLGDDMVIGVSCHDSKHLAMEAGEAGADYVAFGAFHPTTSKSVEALAKYGTPTAEILSWWQEYMLLPCVAIGGINASNCTPLVQAGADFIAVIQAVWDHPLGAKMAVKEFNEVIKNG